ncbi:MAG: hypothetical protein EZS26_001164 [Candidatus Ordinivivax streblomastigis]|uniref:Uncharacterized protein n=1 Tax=Candidatus Ordinivivax streblomastigis TaxID=2540710 RepID=A0A5M8P2E9_9BACT|nr:MAG: hypothetical protein EZS26_001164 [Candidatus Ordinivivax streblomastigis]
MNFKINLSDLIKDAYLWEYADISDTEDDIGKKRPRLFFTKIQWIFILVSIIGTYFISKGFDNDFAGYIISGLSLFTGILFTFVLTLYDKFKSVDFSEYKKEKNEEKNKHGIRLKNFFKKVTVLTLYSAVLSIVCVFLLAITLMVPKINIEISYELLFENIKCIHYYTLIKAFFVTIYRGCLLYFLLDFVLITVYIISSFYDYIISEINKIKLS